MNRKKIFNEIEAERYHQENRWGNDSDDTANDPHDFAAYIALYSNRWMDGQLPPTYTKNSLDNWRRDMIKTAALCVAAVESFDRQREKNGKAFYEA